MLGKHTHTAVQCFFSFENQYVNLEMVLQICVCLCDFSTVEFSGGKERNTKTRKENVATAYKKVFLLNWGDRGGIFIVLKIVIRSKGIIFLVETKTKKFKLSKKIYR